MFPVKQGMRQIERWLIASKQDKHPAIKLLHANYAVGNIDMLRQMYTDAEIMLITGKDPQKLMTLATQMQDEAQGELTKICKGGAPRYNEVSGTNPFIPPLGIFP